jgi:hypothetical protein
MKGLCRLISLWIAAAGFLGTVSAYGESPASTAAFARLTSLVGDWTVLADGQKASVRYSLIANGSTLVEEFVPPNRAETMVTMFSLDGDRLLATHYCAARNQPHMATSPISGSENNPFKFSLLRVTGMRASEEDWHNTSLEVLLEDEDHVTQRWTYLNKGKAGTNTFHFTRVH